MPRSRFSKKSGTRSSRGSRSSTSTSGRLLNWKLVVLLSLAVFLLSRQQGMQFSLDLLSLSESQNANVNQDDSKIGTTLQPQQRSLQHTTSTAVLAPPAQVQVDESHLEWWQKQRPLLSEFPVFKVRNDIIPILEKLKWKRGVEVGVQKGIFAKKILSTWQSCLEYKLIDLWGREAGYQEPGQRTEQIHNQFYNEAKSRMTPWTARNVTEFFPMRSTEAAKFLKDRHFEWVYIDARHDYCAVQEDIQYYWPKVRPGGILAGHDFVDAQYAVSLHTVHICWCHVTWDFRRPLTYHPSILSFHTV